MPPDPDRRVRLSDLIAAGVGIRSIAITIIALLAVLYTLYFAKAVVLPIVIAILLSLLLMPVVRFAQSRLKIPPSLSAGIILVAMVAVTAFGASMVVGPTTAWMQTVPERIPELKSRLKLFQRPIENVQAASRQVEELADLGAAGSEAQVVKIRDVTPASLLIQQTPALIANFGVMFILVYFMLASGDLFLRKLVRMIPTFQDKRRAVEIAHEVEDRISGYLRTITVINAGLGCLVGFAAAVIGLHSPVVWGVLAFLLNFIPYLGALVGISAALVVSLLTFESVWQAMMLPAAYLILNILEGNFITPMIVGRILTLNPVIIFISLMFWGWIWGIPGALLAVPILAAFKIACDHLQPLAPISVFIGGEPDESPTSS